MPSPEAGSTGASSAAPSAGGPDEKARRLLAIARRSIETGLAKDRPLAPDLAELPPELREPAASFVTLRLDGELRGCIGSLEAHAPLATDVAENAFKAAFRDPRFEPVTAAELDELELHVSVLGPLVRLDVASEEELVACLRPGRDGLVLREGARRATYLPSVWEQLPDPHRFVRELKRKAGLSDDHWSPRIECYRYAVEELS